MDAIIALVNQVPPEMLTVGAAVAFWVRVEQRLSRLEKRLDWCEDVWHGRRKVKQTETE